MLELIPDYVAKGALITSQKLPGKNPGWSNLYFDTRMQLNLTFAKFFKLPTEEGWASVIWTQLIFPSKATNPGLGDCIRLP